jgi:hypothetical protein
MQMRDTSQVLWNVIFNKFEIDAYRLVSNETWGAVQKAFDLASCIVVGILS